MVLWFEGYLKYKTDIHLQCCVGSTSLLVLLYNFVKVRIVVNCAKKQRSAYVCEI